MNQIIQRLSEVETAASSIIEEAGAKKKQMAKDQDARIETITLVKDTSLAFTISIAEMFTVAKQIGAAQTSVMPLLAAGIFYYVFNLIVATVMEYIEKRLSYYR